MVFEARQRDLADPGAGQCVLNEFGVDFHKLVTLADLDHVVIAGIGGLHVGPHREESFYAGVKIVVALGDQLVDVHCFAGGGQHAP